MTFKIDIDYCDDNVMGVKALVYIGEQCLVYTRDHNYQGDRYPGTCDLPGGGREDGETPFETIKREIWEEFGLCVNRDDIVYAVGQPSILKPGQVAVFVVIKLSAYEQDNIVFGGEGASYELITVPTFIGHPNAVPALQMRVHEYVMTLRA